MLSEISSTQFAEWIAYARIEPWGEERDDLRMGIIASTLANIHKPKGRKPYKPQDFMPDFEQMTEEQQAARMLTKMRAAFGGRG